MDIVAGVEVGEVFIAWQAVMLREKRGIQYAAASQIYR